MINKGDIVISNTDLYNPYIVNGGEYKVRAINYYRNCITLKLEGLHDDLAVLESFFTKVDTEEVPDIEIGDTLTLRDGSKYSVLTENDRNYILACPERIIKIECNSVKTAWERKEPLYTLELKGKVKNKYYHIRNSDNAVYDYNFEIYVRHSQQYKCVFTQEEIDNLPNQAFIKCLVKELYKGEEI